MSASPADVTNANVHSSASRNMSEEHLDDEKPTQEGQFVGATLSIEEGTTGREMSAAEEAQQQQQVGGKAVPLSSSDPGTGNFDRSARPGSVYSRHSTNSRTSLRPNVVKTPQSSELYFSYKENALEVSIGHCKKYMKEELDGAFQGAWILTEISHWDSENERIVFLNDNSILLFKYNFITKAVLEYKRVMLHIIDTVFIGDFVYPDYSLMPNREHGGIRILWNHGQQLSFGQRWNPWCSDIPSVTLAHHPIIYNPKESETVLYNVDDFYDSLLGSLKRCYESKRPGENPIIVESSILIDSYVSIASIIYNQSSLGFCRDRNGICF